MPIPTPFHSRTSALCESYEWRNWSGYLSAGLYEPSHEREYYAVRNSAALFDVSPLFKYEITGPDAARLVNRIITRDINKCAVGQVYYTPWCDEAGKVIDDGTVSRLGDNHFRITSADPSMFWFGDCAYGMDVTISDVSSELAALALQGPNARKILKEFVKGVDLDNLKYFRLAEGKFDRHPITITRTGYTGDLGYELWVSPKHAERLWDMLMDKGHGYGITPAGIIALDIVRVEAGLLLIEVDYISSHKALIEAQKSSPFELGLGWAVALDKGDFVGRRALLAEKKNGSKWAFVGLDIDWPALEKLYAAVGLTPRLAGRTSRVAVPVYNKSGKQIGQATSSTFSPILKKYIALATIESQYAALGTPVNMEVTVEYAHKQAPATVVKLPFYEPERKKA
ncbi:MAG: aminomethyltransferase family protein [Anaerolineae bacterium]|nr:aminomethyltransferase family protein [Anaerolineae bacterium]